MRVRHQLPLQTKTLCERDMHFFKTIPLIGFPTQLIEKALNHFCLIVIISYTAAAVKHHVHICNGMSFGTCVHGNGCHDFIARSSVSKYSVTVRMMQVFRCLHAVIYC